MRDLARLRTVRGGRADDLYPEQLVVLVEIEDDLSIGNRYVLLPYGLSGAYGLLQHDVGGIGSGIVCHIHSRKAPISSGVAAGFDGRVPAYT